MKKLIITADDFGMSISVNQAIRSGIESGVITSTNVMVGMKYCNEISELLKEYPHLSVGLHWTLTAGYPVSPANEIESLLNNDGKFWSYAEFRNRYRLKKISEEEIKIELVAQYKKYVDICGKPIYWNTHQNVHVDFKIFDLFLDLASELNINKMRSHQRLYVPAKIKSSMPLLRKMLEPAKRIIINNWLAKASKHGMKYPSGLITPLSSHDKLDLEYLFRNIKWKSNKLGELIIHPAISNDSEYFGSITDKRIREYELFSNDSVLSLAKDCGITLCGFEEV